MLTAVLLTVLAAAAGTLATYLYDDRSPLPARFAYGALSGLAVLALVAFVLSHVVGISIAAALAAVGAVAVIALLALAPARRALQADVAKGRAALGQTLAHPGAGTIAPVLYWGAMAAFLWVVFARVIVVSDDGIATGYVNNLGDLPFHMHLSASFAFNGNFPPSDPTLAGSGLAYPYMADFITAMFLALGTAMPEAFFVLNLVLGLSLVVVVYRFTLELTRDRLAAFVAPPLVLLSGGLGWLDALGDARASEQGLLALIAALPQDYTINGDGYRWGNAITTLFVPQRGMLFGVAVSLTVFVLLWRLIRSPSRAGAGEGRGGVRDLSRRGAWAVLRRHPEAIAAGVLTGLLPLIHAHSFAVVMGTAFLLGVLFRQWRDGRWLPWAAYVVAALALALPELWISTRGATTSASAFVGIELGWDHGQRDPVTFWLLNAGMFLPLTLLPLAVPRLRRRLPVGLALFSIPFLVWFVVPNVIRLAPWIWDNIKVLFYWYVGLVPLAALVIAWLLRDRPALRVAGVALMASLVLAGSLDVWRVISGQAQYGEFDRDAVAIARHVMESTPPGSLVLHAPTWNTPAFLTGRQSLIGYPGHIWSRGLDAGSREADVRAIYSGDPNADALLERYGVDYILVTPHEREMANPEFLSQFTEVASAGEYRLLEVTP